MKNGALLEKGAVYINSPVGEEEPWELRCQTLLADGLISTSSFFSVQLHTLFASQMATALGAIAFYWMSQFISLQNSVPVLLTETGPNTLLCGPVIYIYFPHWNWTNGLTQLENAHDCFKGPLCSVLSLPFLVQE